MNINNLTVKARVRIHRPPAEVFNAFVDASSMSKFSLAHAEMMA